MSRKLSYRKGQIVLYIFFVCLSFVLMVSSQRSPYLYHKFSQGLVVFMSPFLHISAMPGRVVDESLSEMADYVTVAEENRRLRKENRVFRTMYRKMQLLQQENEQLKKLMGMASSLPAKPLSARLMDDKQSPFTKTALINVGEDKGVKIGQAVVNELGLVGRVLDVFGKSSRILLLTDYTSRIPVKILETRIRAIVRGTNGRMLEIIAVEDNEEWIKEGMVVVTSGSGGVFTPGVPVGVIQKEKERFVVKPEVDFNKLDVITVSLKNVEGVLATHECQ